MPELLARAAPVGGAAPARFRSEGIEIDELPFVAKLRIQAARRDVERLRDAAAAIPHLLPFAPNRAVALGAHGAGGSDPWLLWRAPGDWLAYSLALDAAELEAALRDRIHATTAAIRLHRTDVSSLFALFELSGPLAVETLMRSLTLDLEGGALPPGTCAQTVVAQVTVTLHRPGAAELWRLGVDRSAARYLWEWLVDSAELAGATRR